MSSPVRRLTLFTATALLLIAAKDDALGRYGYSPSDLEDACFESISGDGFLLPQISSALRALPVESRSDAVLALGKAVRAFVESKAFKERWAAAVKQHAPTQAPVRASGSEQLKASREALAKQSAQIKESIKALPPEQRAQVEAAMKQALAAQEQAAAQSAADEPRQEAHYKEELERYNQAKARWPADPKARVRATLERFLASTADVDFDAQLVDQYGMKRFKKDAYEQKPNEWKMAFRLGKGATTAARKFAQDWLKALR